MKLNNIVKFLLAGSVMSLLASCHNQEQIFPDYDDGITAYFAYQYPVRTIVLGESETFDTSLDNQHKCIIYGTMGGAYKGKDIVIDIEVDNTLVDNLYFADGSPVKYMPGHYYDLSTTQLDYKGTHMGGVEVALHDAFFNDPDAIKNTYVIPVKMTNIVKGADQILAGTPAVEGQTPLKTDASQWKVLPKDYTLYAVKYINKWDGSWLRRGVDTITDVASGEVTTDVRHKQYVENDEVMYLTTQSLNSVTFPMTINVEKLIPPDPEYAMSMTNATASNPWDAQVWYEFSEPLASGKSYTFTCMAKATSAGSVGVFLQDTKDSGHQQYGAATLNLTTEWSQIKVDFTPGGEGYDKFTINFGDYSGTITLDRTSFVLTGDKAEMVPNGDFLNGDMGLWKSYHMNDANNPYPVISEDGYAEVQAQPTIQIVPVATDLVLTFSDDNQISVSSGTAGITATGNGTFVKDGEKKAWGNKDRDGIYLNYEVNFGEKIYAIKDTLVSRSREVSMETFSPTYKK